MPDGTSSATVTLNFPVVPSHSAPGTYARFRLSTDAAAANPTGPANDGEVEDYQATNASAPLALTATMPGLAGELSPLSTVDVTFNRPIDAATFDTSDVGLLDLSTVSGPDQVTLLGGYDTTDWAYDVEVVGNRAYVADRFGGLEILDVTDPAAVTRLGGYDTSGRAYDVQVVGNLAYVADHDAGLEILDVTDPGAVTRLGGFDTSGYAFDVDVVGNLAYVADYTEGLEILDVTDPGAVTRLGGFDASGQAYAVEVVGNLAYVAGYAAGLHILDISDPAAIKPFGRARYIGLCP